MTIRRTIGTPKEIAHDPARITMARRSLHKVVERLSLREVPLVRVERLRVDAGGRWVVDRIVLLKGKAKLGRIKSASITHVASTQEAIEWFCVLAGSNWTNAPADEITARHFVDELNKSHRVETFNGFGKLLKNTACGVECASCGAQAKIEVFPLFAAPTLPNNWEEWRDALERLRGSPRIRRRQMVTAA